MNKQALATITPSRQGDDRRIAEIISAIEKHADVISSCKWGKIQINFGDHDQNSKKAFIKIHIIDAVLST